LRDQKPRLLVSAPNLPHTYGFWEEGEFFAIKNICALKRAKKREKPPQKTRKRLNGGVALNHGNSQATARREFREQKEGFL